VAKVIERLNARYEIQELEFGKVYKWCPEKALLKCNCGEITILTASRSICSEFETNHAALLRGVLDFRHEEKADLPWRSTESLLRAY
jgi:hypothetical protein